jgi:hypothetical protein
MAVTVTAIQIHQELAFRFAMAFPGGGNRVPVMAGNDFEIKKNFAWKTGIFQQVTEVRATLVILPDPAARVEVVSKAAC